MPNPLVTSDGHPFPFLKVYGFYGTWKRFKRFGIKYALTMARGRYLVLVAKPWFVSYTYKLIQYCVQQFQSLVMADKETCLLNFSDEKLKLFTVRLMCSSLLLLSHQYDNVVSYGSILISLDTGNLRTDVVLLPLPMSRTSFSFLSTDTLFFTLIPLFDSVLSGPGFELKTARLANSRTRCPVRQS